LGSGPLPVQLAEMLARRIREMSPGDEPSAVPGPFTLGEFVPLSDLVLLMDGRLDEDRIAGLIIALSLIDPSSKRAPATAANRILPVSPLLAVVAPFFSARPIRLTTEDGPLEIRLVPESRWSRLLVTASVHELAADCLRRLRVLGLRPALETISVGNQRSMTHRLVLALCCRTSPAADTALLSILISNPETMEKINVQQ